MPYILKAHRNIIDPTIKDLQKVLDGIPHIDNRDLDGILNYVISNILLNALDLRANTKYTKINTAIGVLECVKAEFYRRVGAPYENKAKKKNGDIF